MAIVLTRFIVARSLTQHVVIQHIAGRRVGTTDYTHFLVESASDLSVAVYIALQVRKNRRKDITG